jgi:hypothetical protein
MLYREIITVFSEIRTKHINTPCGQNVEFLEAFVKSRRMRHVCPSARPRGTARLAPARFSLYLILFENVVKEIQVSLICDNNWYGT